MLTILITIIAIIGWIGCVYYYGKAKENGHLFELSKDYNRFPSHTYKYKVIANNTIGTTTAEVTTPKLNKDGSIAKKRGRKSNVKTT